MSDAPNTLRQPKSLRKEDIREIVVLSGKGGTGKTSLTAAFAQLAGMGPTGHVICDLDVDAPDLHILLQPRILRREAFVSGFEARISHQLCTDCGACLEACRFDAIARDTEGRPEVDGLRCEGCKVCVSVCPAGAVDFLPKHCGDWYVSETRFGPMVHAQLFPGEENSGRLVALLKRQGRELAAARGLGLMLCDGTPGIGCPVISSLSGANLVVAVSEPTPSGRHDLERVAQLCDHFRIPLAVLVNKHDLAPDNTEAIVRFCRERGHVLLGRLPLEPQVTRAMVQRQTIAELAEQTGDPAATGFVRELAAVWHRILTLLGMPEFSAQAHLDPAPGRAHTQTAQHKES